MHTLAETAPAFIDTAHRIVWATVATVGPDNRPRSRILHPVWEFDGTTLTGWIGTDATPLKRAHLDHSPFVSVNYWDPQQDVATAECHASWATDDATRARAWELFKQAPEPVGYDPALMPQWAEGPNVSSFTVIRIEPWRLHVFPGSVMLEGTDPSAIRTWQA